MLRILMLTAATLGAVVSPDTALAQAAPGILRDGSIGPDANTQPVGPDYVIEEAMGERGGGNLFHSFSDFDIASGESATFTGSEGIDAVISRVTGGTPSAIHGVLRSTIPSADLYLLNPAGVLLGEGAALEVPGAFYASTADFLAFGDVVFPTALAAPFDVGALTVAAPTAFGFLDPGGVSGSRIRIDSTHLELEEGQRLGLIGRDVELGNSSLFLPGGRLEIVVVASEGELAFDAETGIVGDADAFAELGPLDLSRTEITLDGEGAGGAWIRGGEIVFEKSAKLRSYTRGQGTPATIDIEAREDLILERGEVRVGTSAGSAGPDVSLAGRRVRIREGGVFLESTASSTGGLGTLEIRAEESIELSSDKMLSRIFRDMRGSGVSGDTTVRSARVNFGRNALVESKKLGATRGGDFTVIADHVEIQDGAWIRTAAEPPNVLDPGNTPAGDGGESPALRIEALESVLIQGNDPLDPLIRSGLTTLNSVRSRGGDITLISQGDLVIRDGGRIETMAVPDAALPAGDIDVAAARIEIARNGEIVSSTRTDSAAGGIRVRADESISIIGTDLTGLVPGLESESTGISSRSQVNAGDAGPIEIVASELLLSEGALISTASLVRGQGGRIGIQAERVDVSGGSVIDSSTVLFGPGGPIVIDASDSVVVRGRSRAGRSSRIGSVGLAWGDAGDVTVRAPTLIVDGGTITTTTAGVSNLPFRIPPEVIATILEDAILQATGNRITIPVESVGQVYASLAPFLGALDLPPLNADDSLTVGLAEVVRVLLPERLWGDQEFRDADAGNIHVEAARVEVLGGGEIDSSSFSGGAAGEITIDATELLRVAGEGSLVGSRPGTGGAGGGLDIRAGQVRLEAGGRLSVASGDSELDARRLLGGGLERILNEFLEDLNETARLVVDASGLTQIDAELVNSLLAARPRALSPDGGSLLLVADALSIDHGRISAGADEANGGNVTVEVAREIRLRSGSIDGTTREGSGGNVIVNAGELIELEDSAITATAEGGTGDGGNVSVDPLFVLLKNSQILARAEGGQGGNIDVTTRFLFSDPTSSIDASSSRGIDGTVNLRAPEVDIAGSITGLSDAYLDATILLREECSARRSGTSAESSFVSAGSGVPSGPDALLPASVPGLPELTAPTMPLAEGPVRQIVWSPGCF